MKKSKFWLAAILFLGIYVRVLGYFGKSLWVDEAWRANLLLQGEQILKFFTEPDVYGAITPPMYVLLNRLFTVWTVSEDTLRLSSLVPSILTLYFAFRLVERLSRSSILALGITLIFALNVQFVSYAKELKPYALEVFLMVYTFYRTVLILEMKKISEGPLGSLVALLVGGLLTSAVAVFLWPAVLMSLLLKAFQDKDGKGLRDVVGGIVFLSVLSLGLYFLTWSKASGSQDLLAYWREGFVGESESRWHFWALQTKGLFQQSFGTHRSLFLYFPSLKEVFGLLWLGMILISFWVCFRRRKNFYPLLFWGPLGVLLVLNSLGKWPYGPLRVNLFLLPSLILGGILFSGACEKEKEKRRIRRAGWILTFIFGVMAMPPARSFYRSLGPPQEDSRLVFEELARRVKQQGLCSSGRVLVLMNSAISNAQKFYLHSHSDLKESIGGLAQECLDFEPMFEAYSEPEIVEGVFKKALEQKRDVWAVYSHLSSGEENKLMEVAKKVGSLSELQRFENAGLFLLSR